LQKCDGVRSPKDGHSLISRYATISLVAWLTRRGLILGSAPVLAGRTLHPAAVAGMLAGIAIMFTTGLVVSA
jgi:hypothetical protein